MEKAREFVCKFWFDNGIPSKSIIILGWYKNGKLTIKGKNNYKILYKNLQVSK